MHSPAAARHGFRRLGSRARRLATRVGASRAALWLGRHPTPAAAAIYLALAVALVGGGLLPGKTLSASDYLWTVPPWDASAPAGVGRAGSNPEQVDAVFLDQPFLEYAGRTFPGIAQWNPHVMAGRPFAAQPISGAFSLFSLPAYALSLWSALAVIAVMKLFVAAMGTYLLGRALGMRFAGALLAGLVFGFGFFATVGLSLQRFRVFAFLPWVLLLVEAVVRRPRVLIPMVGLAVVVGLQFLSGMPEASAAVLIAAAAFAAWRVVGTRARGDDRWRAAGMLSAGAVAGVGLAGVLLVPFAEALFTSYDYRWRSQFSGGGVPPKFLLGLFLPDYWGRSPHTQAGGDITLLIDRAMYPGAIALMLAGAAVALRPTRERIGIALFGVLALLLAVELDPLVAIWEQLPLLQTMKLNYLLVWPTIAIAVLAGWGLDDLARRRGSPERLRGAVGIGVVGLLVPVVWMIFAGTLSLDDFSAALSLAWGSIFPQEGETRAAGLASVVHMSALLEWLVPALLALALIALRAKRVPLLSARVFAVLALALVALDLWHIGAGVNPVIPRSEAVQPTTPAIERLQARHPARFVGLASGFASVFPPNLAMRYGLNDARGYDSPVDLRFGTFWSTAVQPLLPGTPLAVADPPQPGALKALGLLSVSSVMQHPSAPLLEEEGLRVAYDGKEARVYTNEAAIPRTFLVDRQRVVATGDQALRAVTEPEFDATRVAVTEHRLPGIPSQREQVSAPSAGTARLIEDAGDKVTVEVTARRPALLVITDAFSTGWRANVDGDSRPVERVDYILRGIQVPAGAHRVELVYRPTTSWVGLGLSIVTAGMLLGVVGLDRRRRRRRPA